MRIRAKFRCDEVTKRPNWIPAESRNDGRKFLYVAKFSVVVSDSEENAKFFEATPFGTLEIGMYKEDHFEPGKEYYLDLSPSTPPGPPNPPRPAEPREFA